MNVPGQAGHFGSFDNYPIANDGQHLAFIGSDSVFNPTIYYSNNGVLQSMVATGASAPGGGSFLVNQIGTGVSVDGSNLALSTSITNGSAVFTEFSGGPLQRLIGTGDTLLGRQVKSVQIGEEALSGFQVVFWSQFTDGSSGIFVATVPEPTTITMFLMGVAGISTLQWRKTIKVKLPTPGTASLMEPITSLLEEFAHEDNF